jgi:hypothetical protein
MGYYSPKKRVKRVIFKSEVQVLSFGEDLAEAYPYNKLIEQVS